MDKCMYCEAVHPPMTPEEVAEIEREVLSDHIPDWDKLVHDMVRLVAEIRRLRKDLDIPKAETPDRQHLLERCYLELYASMHDEREHKREDCLQAARAIANRISEIDNGKSLKE